MDRSNNNLAYFIIGGLVIAVAVLGYLFMEGRQSGGVEINVSPAKIDARPAN